MKSKTRKKKNKSQNFRSKQQSRYADKDQWSVVSFFSGCGGLDLGFVGGFNYNKITHPTLPYEIIKAYDNDQKCIDTYKHNMHQYHKNFEPNSAEVKNLASFNPKSMPKADVLIGGFPCQEFAVCGPRKGLNSERGKLYKALLKYAKHHRPKIIVGENVPGLMSMFDGKVLKIITDDIEKIGYRVEVWPMFAPDYGVPQKRARVFIICVRDDIKTFPQKPKRTHQKAHRTSKWALKDLEKIKSEKVPNQSQYFKAARAKQGHGQGDEKLCPDQPGYTMRANAKSRVQFHYSHKRRLTVRECARLQTFPDNFVFPHAATANIMQIGNAVPPMLAHRVAKSISSWLEKI